MKPLSPTLALARRPWRVSTSTMQQVLLPWVPAAVTREAAACITALHQTVSGFNDGALCDSQNGCTSRPYRDALLSMSSTLFAK